MIESVVDIDRQLLLFFNGSHSLFFDALMYVLTSGFTWICLYVSLLYLVIKNNETMGQVMLVVGCAVACVVLSGGVSDYIIKPLVGRLRPTTCPELRYVVDTVQMYRPGGYSFFSSHAANTVSLLVFFSLLVRNARFIMAMAVWSLVNCYTRLYLGVHYPTDVLVGMLWGGGIGLLAYMFYSWCYNKISPECNFISSHYTSTGYSYSEINIVINVLAFTLLYSVIKALVVAI